MSRLWNKYFMTTWSILLEHKNIIQLYKLFVLQHVHLPPAQPQFQISTPPPPTPPKKKKSRNCGNIRINNHETKKPWGNKHHFLRPSFPGLAITSSFKSIFWSFKWWHASDFHQAHASMGRSILVPSRERHWVMDCWCWLVLNCCYFDGDCEWLVLVEDSLGLLGLVDVGVVFENITVAVWLFSLPMSENMEVVVSGFITCWYAFFVTQIRQ